MRKDLVEENTAEETFQVRTLVKPFNLSPGRLNQPAVFDPRRARRLAGPAVETKIHMPYETFPNRQPPAFHLDHLVDPPAGRVHLEAQFAVRGAGVQAEAAVNALRVNVPAGRFARTIVARFFCGGRFYFHNARAACGDETGVRVLECSSMNRMRSNDPNRSLGGTLITYPRTVPVKGLVSGPRQVLAAASIQDRLRPGPTHQGSTSAHSGTVRRSARRSRSALSAAGPK